MSKGEQVLDVTLSPSFTRARRTVGLRCIVCSTFASGARPFLARTLGAHGSSLRRLQTSGGTGVHPRVSALVSSSRPAGALGQRWRERETGPPGRRRCGWSAAAASSRSGWICSCLTSGCTGWAKVGDGCECVEHSLFWCYYLFIIVFFYLQTTVNLFLPHPVPRFFLPEGLAMNSQVLVVGAFHLSSLRPPSLSGSQVLDFVLSLGFL